MMWQSQKWEDRLGSIETAQILVHNQFADQYLWQYLLVEKFSEMTLDQEYKVRNEVGPFLKACFENGDRDQF